MPKPKCFLVPVDFSPRSREALDYACELAKPLKAKVVLLHAIEPMVFPAIPTQKAGAGNDHGAWVKKTGDDLAKLAAGLKKKKIPVATMLKSGRASQEITLAAKESGADLIVMGSEGYAGGSYALLGSTAERVARRAPCPVLLVREKGRIVE
jgi:universal stress protein A